MVAEFHLNPSHFFCFDFSKVFHKNRSCFCFCFPQSYLIAAQDKIVQLVLEQVKRRCRLQFHQKQVGAAVVYWSEHWIQGRNENFECKFDSCLRILFRKLKILSESRTITAVIIYRCYPVTLSRQQPKYTQKKVPSLGDPITEEGLALSPSIGRPLFHISDSVLGIP